MSKLFFFFFFVPFFFLLEFFFEFYSKGVRADRLFSLGFHGRGLLCTDGEELGDDFQGHSLCLRNLEVDKHPWNDTHDGVEAKDSGEADGVEHERERVGHDDVTDPESEGADGDAEASHPSREDLGAEDVWDWAESHDKGAEVGHDTEGRDRGVDHAPHAYHAPQHQDRQRHYQHRDRVQQ